MSFEEQYMNALNDVLSNGFNQVNKRTGQGVKRMPHVRFQVDLSKEIPCLQSKKLFVQSASDEIMWIMQRQSNKRADINSSIWNEWTGSDGTIGKAYGYQIYPDIDENKEVNLKSQLKGFVPLVDITKFGYSNLEEYLDKEPVIFKKQILDDSELHDINGILADAILDDVVALWKEMMTDCYVGLSGTSVSEDWQSLRVFVQQFKYIKGYKRLVKKGIPSKDWTLSLNYNATDCYALDTVILATLDEDNEWAEDLAMTNFEIKDADILNLEFTRPILEINQVSEVIRGIITDPSSRRLVINLWNIYDKPDMNLEPCCFASDFTVIDGVLHCAVTQRSGDSCLGVPFNMYQYAMLTYMLANATGLKPGLLTLSIADFHIYTNQIEGAELQLKRYNLLKQCKDIFSKVKNKDEYDETCVCYIQEFKELGVDLTVSELDDLVNKTPFLSMPIGKCFYDLTLEDVKLYNYFCLPKITYEVAV